MQQSASLISRLIPNHTGREEPSCLVKVVFLFFPRFKFLSFTFFFGLAWAGINTFLAIKYKVDHQSPCLFLFWGASIPAYIRYYQQYWRIFLGGLYVDNIPQILLGFYIIWSYGFLYEHHIDKCRLYTIIFGASLIGALIICFLNNTEAFGYSASGSIMVAAWSSVYLFMLWDILEYNILLRLVKMGIYFVKVTALFASTLSPDNSSDATSTVFGYGFGFLLAMALIKKIDPNTPEDRKFIFMRLKIFIMILAFIFLLLAATYATVMFSDKKDLILLSNKTFKGCTNIPK